MSVYQKGKTIASAILLLFLVIGCSGTESKEKKMNNFEKHFSKLYDTDHVSVTFEKWENESGNEAWPDSFDCAVVEIIDSDYLGETIDDKELFRTEYDKIENFLRDSAQTINPQIFGLALTVIDTFHIEQNKIGPFSSGTKLTKFKSIEPTLITGY